MPHLTELRDRRVTVMGLGLFGGGVGVTRFLARQGARVTVTDLRAPAELADSVAQLAGLDVRCVLGEHRPEDFTHADLVVVNPAVPKSSPFLALAREHHVPLCAEMNLFFERCPARTIGVTGSNGKSTTTAMLGEILRHTPSRVWVGGNIGRCLIEQVAQIQPGDWVVLELSSFQLEDLGAQGLSPHVALVTNISPNHLDRHGTMAAYVEAKQQIVRHQRTDDRVVLNLDDDHVRVWDAHTDADPWWFSHTAHGRHGTFEQDAQLVVRDRGGVRRLDVLSRLLVPGRHNRTNALAAAAAAASVGVADRAIAEGLASFTGLPHRLEAVAQRAGVRFYNDSIATTPASVMVALQAFAEPVILIAGGYDKKVDLSELARHIAEQTKAVVLIGQTGPALAEWIGQAPAPPLVRSAATMDEAVGLAADLAEPGDVVLLSPGCASYDMFRNFEDRAARFVDAVARLDRP